MGSEKVELCPAGRRCGDGEVLSPLCALYLKSAFADPVTQVVKLRPADLAAGRDLNLRDPGGMQLEHSFHSFSVGNLPYGKGGIDRTPTPSNDYACKNLDPFLAPFTNERVDLDGVSNVEIRDFLLELLLLDFPDDVHGLYWGGRMSLESIGSNSALGGREGYTMPLADAIVFCISDPSFTGDRGFYRNSRNSPVPCRLARGPWLPEWP